MKIKKFIPIHLILIFVILLAAGCSTANNAPVASKYDGFAKCLADNGTKMYGAYWCQHCASQKQMFGDSFEFVNYIECSLPNRAGQTQECKDARINAYPTWEFKDGKRIEGELALGQLSQYSGCSLS